MSKRRMISLVGIWALVPVVLFGDQQHNAAMVGTAIVAQIALFVMGRLKESK